MGAKLAIAMAAACIALGAVWIARRNTTAGGPATSELAARPRPRRDAPSPTRDDELAAMLSELLRTPVELAEPADELVRLEAAGDESAEVAEQSPPPAPLDASALMLGDEREPNVARADGMLGARIKGEWPNGGPQFEAEQALDEDGAWRLDGAWRAWYPNGQLEELGGYVQGFEHGKWNWWWSNGAAMAHGAFDEGVRVGEWVFWHPNGVTIGEGRYVDGLRSGPWIFRGADGRVREDFSGTFEEGRRVGP